MVDWSMIHHFWSTFGAQALGLRNQLKSIYFSTPSQGAQEEGQRRRGRRRRRHQLQGEPQIRLRLQRLRQGEEAGGVLLLKVIKEKRDN